MVKCIDLTRQSRHNNARNHAINGLTLAEELLHIYLKYLSLLKILLSPHISASSCTQYSSNNNRGTFHQRFF